VNQGGAMVEAVLRQVNPMLPIKQVHATQGKSTRAEPVAALYEQGRVSHGRGLDALESQMCLMTPSGYEGSGSPDRVDALVWALTELMLAAGPVAKAPRLRVLR
jgi:phage terminase large subunit-like protein